MPNEWGDTAVAEADDPVAWGDKPVVDRVAKKAALQKEFDAGGGGVSRFLDSILSGAEKVVEPFADPVGATERGIEGAAIAAGLADPGSKLLISPNKAIGQFIDTAGQMSKAAIQDLAAGGAALVTGDNLGTGNLAAFTKGQPSPYEEAIKGVGGPSELIANVTGSIAHMAPALLLAKGLGAAGATPAGAAAGAFGWTPEGFDPKTAAIMGAFPGVSELGKKVALDTAGKYVASETGRAALEQLGGLAASQAWLDVTSLPDYATMTTEEFKKAWAHNAALNLGMHLPGLPGIVKAKFDQSSAAKIAEGHFEMVAKDTALQLTDPRMAQMRKVKPMTAEALEKTAKEFGPAEGKFVELTQPNIETPAVEPAKPPTEPAKNEFGDVPVIPAEQVRMTGAKLGDFVMSLDSIHTVGELRNVRTNWEESADDPRQQHALELINARIEAITKARGGPTLSSPTKEPTSPTIAKEPPSKPTDAAFTLPTPEEIVTQPDFATRAESHQGQYGSGRPGLSREIGANTKTPEQLKALQDASAELESKLKVARAANDNTAVMDLKTRKNIVDEAIESATVGDDIRKSGVDPAYVAPMSETKPTAKATPKPEPDQPPDIISDFEEQAGGQISLQSAREFDMTFKPPRGTEKHFSKDGGVSVDDALGALHAVGKHLGIGDESAFLDAWSQAASSRKGNRAAARKEAGKMTTEGQQLADWEREALPQRKGTQPLPTEDMRQDMTFDVNGETVRVEKLNFDPDTTELVSVEVEGGDVYGRQTIKAGQAIHPDAKTVSESAVEDWPVGMGADVKAKPGDRLSSVKNAYTSKLRQELGLPERIMTARREHPKAWDEAMAKIDVDASIQDRLIAEVSKNPRPLADWENMLLLHRQIELRTEFAKVSREQGQAYSDAKEYPNRLADHERLKVRANELRNELQTLIEATESVGKENSLGLSSRRALATEEFELVSMENELASARDGNPISAKDLEKEQALAKEHNEKIAATQKAEEEAVAKSNAESAKVAADEALKAMRKEVEKELGFSPRIAAVAKRLVEQLEKEADVSREWLRKNLGKTNLPLIGGDPAIIYHLAKIGAAKLARATMTFAEWSKSMLDEFGEAAKKYLPAAWEASKEAVDKKDLAAEPSGAPARKRRRAAVLDNAEQREKILDGLEKAVADERPKDEIGAYAQKLALTFVRDGITERNPLNDAIHAELVKFFPDITKSETMEAWTGFGQFRALDAEPAKATLRELKGQGQQVLKLERIEAKQPLPRSGQEHAQPGAEWRRLKQQVNEAMRRFGVVVTDPARQLKSTLDGIKTRMRNRMADLRFQIAAGAKTVKNRTATPTDAEIEALRPELDALEAQFKEIFPKQPITDAERLSRAERAAERNLEELERKVAAKDISVKEPRRVTSAKLEGLRARRDAARAELEAIRATDAKWKAAQDKKYQEKTLASAQAGVEELVRKINEGDIAVGAKPAKTVSAEVAAVRAERAELQKIVRVLRSALQNKKTPEDVARSAIQELERRISEGDIAARKRVPKPVSAELTGLREYRSQLNKIIGELRRAASWSPDAALADYKARLTASTARWQERVANNDFEPRKKREFRLDKEALLAKSLNEKAKGDWQHEIIKKRLEQRTIWEKSLDIPGDLVRAQRNLFTAFDLSAVGRQGAILSGSHPMAAAQAGLQMLKAISGKQAGIIWESRTNRSNYSDGSYNVSKMFLSDPNSFKPSAIEENLRAKWMHKFPGIKQSNQTYATMLNELRMNSFDIIKANVESHGTAMTIPELLGLGNYINITTGRGDFGKLNSAADAMAIPFFSPRLVASRFQWVLGQPFFKAGSRRMQYAIAKEYARSLSSFGVVIGLGLMAGATVEWDPRSGHFMELKNGDTYWDFSGGLKAATVFMARNVMEVAHHYGIGEGGMKSGKGGIYSLAGPPNPTRKDIGDVWWTFIKSKRAPWMGTASEFAFGRDYNKRPVSITDAAWHSIVALSWKDIYGIMTKDGVPNKTASVLLAVLGFGVRVEDDKAYAASVSAYVKKLKGLTPEEREAVKLKMLSAGQEE